MPLLPSKYRNKLKISNGTNLMSNMLERERKIESVTHKQNILLLKKDFFCLFVWLVFTNGSCSDTVISQALRSGPSAWVASSPILFRTSGRHHTGVVALGHAMALFSLLQRRSGSAALGWSEGQGDLQSEIEWYRIIEMGAPRCSEHILHKILLSLCLGDMGGCCMRPK